MTDCVYIHTLQYKSNPSLNYNEQNKEKIGYDIQQHITRIKSQHNIRDIDSNYYQDIDPNYYQGYCE